MSSTAPTRRLPRKKIAALVAALLILGGGAGAFAYWSTLGSGTGSATTGSNTQSVTVNQTSTVSNLRPGGAAQVLSGTFTNPSEGPLYVRTVTVAIASVTLAQGVTGTCNASDYTLANATMTVNAEVPAGTSQGSWTGATIAFNNKPGANQDACQGATVSFSYTSN